MTSLLLVILLCGLTTKALGKPKDNNDAFEMLKSLSGHTHEVITSVCFKSVTTHKKPLTP